MKQRVKDFNHHTVCMCDPDKGEVFMQTRDKDQGKVKLILGQYYEIEGNECHTTIYRSREKEMVSKSYQVQKPEKYTITHLT